ncbi:MAG TPA: tetratricopeptide repeat protein [Polyangiaceae bacterium]|nr:tetratricopeptide repeat protein [Polyangiaceae bacterium]
MRRLAYLLGPYLLGLALFAHAATADAQKKEVRRDPRGLKGISPYNEELAKGRKAIQSKNLDAAAGAFQKAIAKDPKKAHGYLLLAQVQLEKGDVDAALKTAEDGRSKAGSDAVVAQLGFLRASLLERKNNSAPGADNAPGAALDGIAKKWQEPKTGWSDYATLAASKPGAADYRPSAEERIKQIDARVKRDNDYAAVRKRIQEDEKGK